MHLVASYEGHIPYEFEGREYEYIGPVTVCADVQVVPGTDGEDEAVVGAIKVMQPQWLFEFEQMYERFQDGAREALLEVAWAEMEKARRFLQLPYVTPDELEAA